MKTNKYKVGDWVRIVRIPPHLNDPAGIDTPGVFRRALGGTFRIVGLGARGRLELVVAEHRPSPDRYESDTLWIEAEFVTRVARRARVIPCSEKHGRRRGQ